MQMVSYVEQDFIRARFMLAFLSIMYSFKKEVKGTVLVVLVPKYT